MSGQYDFFGDRVRQPPQHVNVSAIDDLSRAITRSMDSPIQFPPIRQAVAPGDRVAIAVGPGVPQVDQIVAAVVEYLHGLGEPSPDVSVICSAADRRMDRFGAQRYRPTDQADNAYLMASQAGSAVYVARPLYEADVVIPISVVDAGAGDALVGDAICPWFCGTVARTELNSLRNPKARAQLIGQINDWLGVFCAVLVVAGPANQVHQIVVGKREVAHQHAWQLSEKIWVLRLPSSSDLVIGTIENDPAETTWDQIAAALLTCSRAATVDGLILICADVQQEPEKHQLLGFLNQDNGCQTPLSPQQQRIADVLQAHVVGLLSGICQETVEQLGIGYLESPEHVNRLIQRHDDCLLIRDAHKCVIS